MGGRKISLTTRYVLAIGVLLLVANSVLGMVSLGQSKAAMRTLIDKDMLDIANAAAASLDGDVLASLTADDVDGPDFNEAKRRLLVFQNNVDIHFIYAVKETDDGRYVFTVDPDPVDPGAFGEEVVTTPALVEAAAGTPAVDSDPAADRWGNFYSAYSPVFDSSGNVAGVVGLDFDIEWYERQVTNNTFSIAAITTLSVVTVGVVIGLIANRVRIRFRELDRGLSGLSESVDTLMSEVAAYPAFKQFDRQPGSALDAASGDELEVLEGKISTMRGEMGLYLEHLHAQAYTDALTKVGSSSAYHETIDALNKRIAEGKADFMVVVFDINSLKELNDSHGHECGDYYIQGAASALAQEFGHERVYRIGGDEFAVVTEGHDKASMEENLRRVQDAIDAFNASSSYPATLSLSQGVAIWETGDTSFKDVFARADQAMYAKKRAFHAAR